MDHPAHFDPANPKWHPEGRIICASFATFDLLATYSPNNGSDPESFARRAAWDKALNEAVVQRNRPLLWIGDLNVAAERIDVTHPDWFAQQCYQEVNQQTCGASLASLKVSDDASKNFS